MKEEFVKRYKVKELEVRNAGLLNMNINLGGVSVFVFLNVLEVL